MDALQSSCGHAAFIEYITPGVSFITVAYAQNGAESGVRDFPPQVCLITVTL